MNMQMDQCSVSFSCITAFPWCNWNRQQYRLSHSRWTQPSGADTVTHWYLLAAKQPQENFSSSSSPLDSSSHPHNSYLSSRVAISTTISKLLPSVPYSPTFFIQFFSSADFLILTSFSLDFHLHNHYSILILFSFSAQHSCYSQLSVQVYTFCS